MLSACAVAAPTPFRAARVHAVDLASGVRYIVFTSEGRYRVGNLFPGTYDVSADPQDNIWTTDGGSEGGWGRFDERTKTFSYYPNPHAAPISKIEITRDGAVWYPFKGERNGGIGVLYPDAARITTLGAYR